MRRAFWVIAGAFGFLTIGAQAASAAEPVLSAPDVTVAEDTSAGQAVVTLRLDRAATRRISVAWKTAHGTAKAADYRASSGTMTFRTGAKVRKVIVGLRDDALDEGTERFFVVIDAARARVPDNRAAVAIRDDDPLPRLSASVKTVTEGALGTRTPAPVTVRLSRASGRAVSFKWRAAHGTALAGVDVKGAGTRSIPAGTTKVTVDAVVVGDNVAEGNEAAPLKLTSPTNATVARHGAVKVTDDDDAATSTDLQLRLATARAASRAFTATTGGGVMLRGGTLQATGSDGTLYRLTVPDGALPYPVTITMTPWRDVEGVSAAGGSFAGVDLKPSGLEFMKAARLEIFPPVGGSDAVAFSFAYSSSGREAHRYPMTRDTSKLEFVVSHFSGVGTYLGDGASIPVAPAPPTDPGQALAAEIERLTAEERERVKNGEAPNDDVMLTIIEYLRSYYTHVVEPLFPRIRQDCAFSKAKLGVATSWSHQAAVLAESSFPAELAAVLDLVGDSAENCLNEAMEPCVDRQDVAQINEMNYWRRWVALMGRAEPDPSPDDPVRDCKDILLGSLVVQYDRSWTTGSGQYEWDEQYTATFNPRLVHAGSGYWMDDGRGGWSMNGTTSLDDTVPGSCADYTKTYTGSGVFRTTMIDNETQLDPDQHLGLANFKIENYVPTFATGAPTVDGDYVTEAVTAGYVSRDGGCEPHDSTNRAWHSIPVCGSTSGPVPGTRKTEGSKQGVEFNCTQTVNTATETLTITVTGTFWLTKG